MLVELFAASVLAAGVIQPYGVATHVTRRDFETRKDIFRMLSLAGIGAARADFDWCACQWQGHGINFQRMDQVVQDAAAEGVTILPILYSPPDWARPITRHLDEWKTFVGSVVKHFKGRIPAVEIWNEENLAGFWPPKPDAGEYVQVLKAAYEAAKLANPDVQVILGGVAGSGIPIPYLRQVYELGAARHFDALAVHPYTNPMPPEGWMDTAFDDLFALMEQYGDRNKPVWITELGWPTHTVNVSGPGNMLVPALQVARPEKKTWNVICAVNERDGLANQDVAASLQEILPVGSTARACGPRETCERLTAGGVDAVIFPFDECYPADTLPAVAEFVRKGGTFVDFGGFPMVHPFRVLPDGTTSFAYNQWAGDWHRKLRIGMDAPWMNDKSIPKGGFKVFTTPIAAAAGVKQEPTGYQTRSFFTDACLQPGDRMIPLLEGTNPNNGRKCAAAAVYALDSDFKGRVVVSGLSARMLSASSEEQQAMMLMRAMGIAFAEGVASVYPYEFRATEEDPYYSENHYGICHANLVPKPAYGAYMNFTRQRPAGSVQSKAAWHDAKRTVYFPQWTRPDGRPAGMIWKPSQRAKRTPVTFEGKDIEFYGLTGIRLPTVATADGAYLIPLGESPVYFVGGRLAGSECIREEQSK